MTPNKYQELAKRTAPDYGSYKENSSYYYIGLNGEAGEVGEILKRHLYRGEPLDFEHLKDELGDVLWYLTMLIDQYGFKLEDIMEENINKLANRYKDRSQLPLPTLAGMEGA